MSKARSCFPNWEATSGLADTRLQLLEFSLLQAK